VVSAGSISHFPAIFSREHVFIWKQRVKNLDGDVDGQWQIEAHEMTIEYMYGIEIMYHKPQLVVK
jgi:hypothetical protein